MVIILLHFYGELYKNQLKLNKSEQEKGRASERKFETVIYSKYRFDTVVPTWIIVILRLTGHHRLHQKKKKAMTTTTGAKKKD